MRQQNKALILIISIFFLFSIQIIAFSPIPVVGNSDGYTEIVGDNVIRYDWLTFEMAEDNNEYMKHNMGGLDLISHENVKGKEVGNNTFEFMSIVKFGYEMNSYLSLDMDNVFPELDTDKMSSYKNYAEISVVDWTQSYTVYGKFRYSYVELGEHVDHDYNLNIPVTIGINPLFSALDGEIINGITVKTSEYLYEVKSMKVVLARDGTCGDYNDIYTTQGELSKGGVDTATLSDVEQTLSQTTVINKIKDLDLGYKTGVTPEYLFPKTIQEILHDSFTGVEYRTNLGTGDLTYDYPIRLQPEITRTRQRIDVRSGGFTYYPPSNVIAFVDPIDSYEINRIISAHIKCPFVHTEYETNVYLLCNVELDAEMYESALDDPFFRKGDWIWDPIIESWDPVVVVLPTLFDDLEDWWDKYGWLVITVIVLIAGLYIFVQVGMPLILKKKATDVVRGR